MWLSDSYDVPQALIDDPKSPAFRQFLLNWFGSNMVSFSERLRTANSLTTDETTVARQLIRRNLKCGRDHITSGTWALSDLEAVPLLREMFDGEPNESRRLVIAGALWKLNKDPVFIECLNLAKKSGLLSVYFHLQQILWLNDERSIDFLIDLLPLEDQDQRERRFLQLRNLCWHRPFRRITNRMLREHNEAKGAGPWALSLLNHLEIGHLVPKDEQKLPSDAPVSTQVPRRNAPGTLRKLQNQNPHASSNRPSTHPNQHTPAPQQSPKSQPNAGIFSGHPPLDYRSWV